MGTKALMPKQKEGKWLMRYDHKEDGYCYRCSECNSRPLRSNRVDAEELSNYCPQCGAHMEK